MIITYLNILALLFVSRNILYLEHGTLLDLGTTKIEY